jgi:hypothetical protein
MKTNFDLNLELMCDVWKNVIHTFDHSLKVLQNSQQITPTQLSIHKDIS